MTPTVWDLQAQLDEAEEERDHYREWLVRLQDAGEEVRGYWGIEDDPGFEDAMGHLAAMLDGLNVNLELGPSDAAPSDADTSPSTAPIAPLQPAVPDTRKEPS